MYYITPDIRQVDAWGIVSCVIRRKREDNFFYSNVKHLLELEYLV